MLRRDRALAALEVAHLEIEVALFQLVLMRRPPGRSHELAVGALDALLDAIQELKTAELKNKGGV
ncbi:hypothetical protein HHJ78_04440 [Mobiluncus mulieris]|uniref:Uncharacterized protein n=1 Tax=Mobiluncus mulieris TaxID=2052 RepID=A0A7Y0U0N9_9ACTO|nr:hypothetical protein [Mobiluncus mulieris]NMW64795.1 hypothetical protein [Mobiluncus mulieris]